MIVDHDQNDDHNDGYDGNCDDSNGNGDYDGKNQDNNIDCEIHLHPEGCRRAEASLGLLLGGDDEQDEVLLVRVLKVQLLQQNRS